MPRRQQMSKMAPLTYRRYDAIATAVPAKRASSGSTGGDSPSLFAGRHGQRPGGGVQRKVGGLCFEVAQKRVQKSPSAVGVSQKTSPFRGKAHMGWQQPKTQNMHSILL